MLAARQLEEVVYQRREPERELLFEVVANNLETFLDRTLTDNHELPAHVHHELPRYTNKPKARRVRKSCTTTREKPSSFTA